jgi:radical SAM-linked protein
MRARIRFTKTGKIRFTSHRDVARVWERALRKAELPVAYTEGFSSRPKLHFGLALSTGHESFAEYLDADLLGDELPGAVGERLTAVLPDGMEVTGVAVIPPGMPSLQEDVAASRWRIVLDGVTLEDAQEAVAAAMAAPALVLTRARKGETRDDDVRPAIEALSADSTDDGVLLDATLATRPRGLRPAELLAAVLPHHADPAFAWRRVVRLQQFIERDGCRSELPPLAGLPAPHALEPACA